MLIHGTNSLPDEIVDNDHNLNNPTPPRMLKGLNRCKDALWKRWSDDYLRSLRERNKCFDGTKSMLRVSGIVQIKGDRENHGEWQIGIITQVIKIKDTVVGAKIEIVSNNLLEIPIQFLVPLELHSETNKNIHQR